MIGIEYSQDFDALIKQKQKEIFELQQLQDKECYEFFKKNNINCSSCRYSWLNDVTPIGVYTFCEMGECKLSQSFCKYYMEETETSSYLRNNFTYEGDAAKAFDDMFVCKMADASLEKVQKFMEMYKMK